MGDKAYAAILMFKLLPVQSLAYRPFGFHFCNVFIAHILQKNRSLS
jgi:hypothetical protein